MSMRGVITGLAGSAAVLLTAAASLGAVRAEADSQPDRRPAVPVLVAPAAKAQPTADHLARPAPRQPAWLRRLLSPSDLEPVRKPG